MIAERDPTARLSRSITRSFGLHVACRIAEALALGWLAAAILLSLSTLGSPGARAGQVLAAALLVGLLAAGSAWIEHVPSPREHLRRVDQRMRFGGALITASEVAGDPTAGPLGPPLVTSVVTRLRGADLARASLPSTPLSILAALLGVALVFAARDFASRERMEVARRAAARVSDGSQIALAEAARLLSQGSRRTTPTAAPTAAEMRSLAEDLAVAARAETLEEAEKIELGRRLSALQERLSPSALEVEILTAAASALGAVSTTTSPDAGANARGKTGPGDVSSPAGLASADPLGKMSGPDPRSADASAGLEPELEPVRAEQGVGSLRWWPARHDAVVEAWLASAPRSK